MIDGLFFFLVLDATGSYAHTFLFGNDYWLGSQSACLDFLNAKNESPPFPVSYYTAKYQINLNTTTLQQRKVTKKKQFV